MDLSATVSGVDRLASTTAEASRDLADLTQVNQDAGNLVAAAVDAPVRTGALAATVHAAAGPDGVALVAGSPDVTYAAPVHARNPFLTRALTAREDAVLDHYADHVERVVDTIQGA